MADYLTTAQLVDLKGSLTLEETSLALKLIPIVCAELRVRADMAGKNLDDMIQNDPDLALVAQSVVADIVMRELDAVTSDNELLTQASQFSESAGGYSVSGTFLSPGGGLFIKRSELARLGLRCQRIGVLEMYDPGGECK